MSLTRPPDHERAAVITGEVVHHDPARAGIAEYLPLHAAAALTRVPGAACDPFDRLVEAFLDEHPANTARGYRTDLRQWVLWLIHEAAADHRTHPLLATRPHVAAWRKHLEATPSPRTGRPLSAASVARKLSAVSELYGYAIELGVLDDNPIDNVERPKVSDESQTVDVINLRKRAELPISKAASSQRRAPQRPRRPKISSSPPPSVIRLGANLPPNPTPRTENSLDGVCLSCGVTVFEWTRRLLLNQSPRRRTR